MRHLARRGEAVSRTLLPFHTDDISAVARSLRSELAARDSVPTHLEMLNMLARAAGYRNFQHFRADKSAQARLEQAPPAVDAAVDHVRVLRIARHFAADGRLERWPTKYNMQGPCIWVMWSRIPPKQTFREREINEILEREHTFGDYALLRRELCNYGLLLRPADGSAYRRIERAPPAEARALIRHVVQYREASQALRQ
jgi:hypothetical protein